ncbi:MAG TPA: 16S rRNA (cytidine(1402)-2'-O)-methyltransferase [Acidimicrobiales bacterium]
MSEHGAGRTVAFRSQGHANITGGHHKTLELTRDTEITRRATCVVGVGSEHDDLALIQLRGRVQVTLACSGVTDSFTATMSPYFLGDDSLVFRTGPGLRGRTVAFDASKGASGLDTQLLAAMAATDAMVEVEITEITEPGRPPAPGALFVVALPIGDDDDLSPRALRVLQRVDLVLAEDTRRFRNLADRLGVELAPSTSYHDHNEAERAPDVLARLVAGERLALVSDAGTPLVSDPGHVLVREVVAAGIGVVPVPGASAVLSALTAAGLPSDRFTFVGFLPRKSGERRALLTALADGGGAIVAYESAQRVAATLRDLAGPFGEWPACLGRELTKVFEELLYGTVEELAEAVADRELKGEVVLVLAPPPTRRSSGEEAGPSAETEAVLRALAAAGVAPSALAKALHQASVLPRRQAYDWVLGRGSMGG